MRTPLLLVLALPAGALPAQNPFVFFPQDPERQTITCASFVRRPDWSNAAEGLQEINAAWFRGLGDATVACEVRGFYHWAADEDITTSETYDVVLRLADATGAPDPTPAGEILRVANLTTPTGTGGPRGSFVMNDYFATPVAVPCAQTWFMGIAFPANANWPATDGHSYWAADTPSASTATVGENPRAGAPNTHWYVDANTITGTRGWTTIMGVHVDGPVLHVGGLDPNNTRQGVPLPVTEANLGLGGLFPDISGSPRSDGLTIRVQDNTYPAGIAFVATGLDFTGLPLAFPGIAGQLHLDLVTTASIGFGLMANGATELPAAAPASLSPVFVGVSLKFQAAVIDPTTRVIRFTNAQSVEL